MNSYTSCVRITIYLACFWLGVSSGTFAGDRKFAIDKADDGKTSIRMDAPVDKGAIPAQFVVSAEPSVYDYCEDLTATTKTLTICNTGKLSNSREGASLNIPGDCDADLEYPDADLYLYDASPMIVFQRNDTDFAYTSLWGQYWDQPGTFQPRTNLSFASVTGEKEYNVAVCSLTTTDSLFGVNMTIVAPTDGNDYVYAIYEFFPLTVPNDLHEVYVGFVADWDVPSDSGIRNSSGYDAQSVPPIIWQRGAEMSSVDEDPPHDCPILENNRYAGVVPIAGGLRNAWTAYNVPMYYTAYAYGFIPDSLYDRVNGQTGYNI